MFSPRLDILPPAQRRLWDELRGTPAHFTLYGGTAIALRLGHRQSADFDFFSMQTFEPRMIFASVPYLKGGVVRQSEANTLTCSVERGGPVLLSFFGGLSLGQVETADRVEGPEIPVASLLDLAGLKVAVVTQRAELKDYLDIHALLTDAKIDLARMLAAAQAVYGDEFNPLIALKALAYHEDAALAQLSSGARRDIVAAVRGVDVAHLPAMTPLRPRRTRA